MFSNIYTVEAIDFDFIDDKEAVIIFDKLLRAEANRLNIPQSKIRVSSSIDVSDGGVDAIVEDSFALSNDLIKAGYTAYQIKASKRFSASSEKDLKKELFGSKFIHKDNLNEQVKRCLDSEGTYILVCFKQSLTLKFHQKAVNHLKDFFTQSGYPNAKFEIWDNNVLSAFINRFPSIVIDIKKFSSFEFFSHQQWSDQAEMSNDFIKGEKQQASISNLENLLRQDDRVLHIHIYGEPGIGKTKFVLEATRAEDLAPLVVYFENPEVFNAGFMSYLVRNDSINAIVIIDDCEPHSRTRIWDKLQNQKNRIRLITIYNEYIERNENSTKSSMSLIKVLPLENKDISKILQTYDVPENEASYRWVLYCEGSPRVAHVIGSNLRDNRQNILRSPDTVQIWERYIADHKNLNSEEVNKMRRVLQYLALFKKFGYEENYYEEARTIAQLIQSRSENFISEDDFNQIIQKFKERRILRGKTTLAITPKALHVKFWSDWWDTYGNSFRLNDFYQQLPDSLISWFNEMFIYATQSQKAMHVVKELLGPNGLFDNNEYLKTRLGASFFYYLAETNPSSALECLQRIIGTWSQQELLEFSSGRRDVLWALEKIVIYQDLFVGAAELILLLAEAENETWSNNASGVFVSLFSLGYGGRVAPTQASPAERFPVLEQALLSTSKKRRKLALDAINRALETRYFVRETGNDYRGLKEAPNTWEPKTYGEWFDAYRQIWGFLRNELDNLPEEDEQHSGVAILLDHTPGLGGMPNLSEMVFNTWQELLDKPYVSKDDVLKTVTRLIFYEGKNLPDELLGQWENFKRDLTGVDFSSKLRRFITASEFDSRLDEQGNYVDTSEAKLEEMVSAAFESRQEFLQALDWLVSIDHYRSNSFGYKLGKRDNDFSLLNFILDAQRKLVSTNLELYFLGGYFRALYEDNPQKWESTLETLKTDDKLKSILVVLIARSGISNQAVLRVLDLARQEEVSPNSFYAFRYANLQEVSPSVFEQVYSFLISKADIFSVHIALILFDYYYSNATNLQIMPIETALQLLLHPTFFEQKSVVVQGDYVWMKLAQTLIDLHPETSLKLVDVIFEYFGERNIIFSTYTAQMHELLDKAITLYPQEIWELAVKHISIPMDGRSYHLTQWLHGSQFLFGAGEKNGAALLLAPENFWKWVDQDVTTRAAHFASFVPKDLTDDPTKFSLVRELLTRYGNREDVRRRLLNNYGTDGWTGSRSVHFQFKRQEVVKILENETHTNVKKWLKEYLRYIEEEIELSEVAEERDLF